MFPEARCGSSIAVSNSMTDARARWLRSPAAQKHGSRRLGPEVESIVERVLRQHYLVLEPPQFFADSWRDQSGMCCQGFSATNPSHDQGSFRCYGSA